LLIPEGIIASSPNPVRADLNESLLIKPTARSGTFFPFPEYLGTTPKVDDENATCHGLKKSVPPTDLRVVEYQIRPWISAQQCKWKVELADSRIGCPSASFFTLQSKRAIQSAGGAE
jgi:hypothetical protein